MKKFKIEVEINNFENEGMGDGSYQYIMEKIQSALASLTSWEASWDSHNVSHSIKDVNGNNVGFFSFGMVEDDE